VEPSSRPDLTGTGRATGHPGAVIVPLDGSAGARAALPLATYLSTSFRAPLHRVSVSLQGGTTPGRGQEAHADALTLLQGGAAEAPAAAPARATWTATGGPPPPPTRTDPVGVVSADGNVEVVLQGDSVATALAGYVARHPDGLVCMATRARGGLHRRLVGNVVEELLAHASCPVIAVGPRVEIADTAERPETILLVAAAEPPRATVPLLATWARILGAQIVVAQVPSSGHPGGGGAREDRQAADRMVSWFARHRAPAMAQRLHGGPVTTALLDLAEMIGGPMLVAAPVAPHSGPPISDQTHELLQRSRWPVVASVGNGR